MDLQDKGGKGLGGLSLRDRVTPRLNLEATSLQTLISWKLEELHEPVFTCKLTKEELNQYLEKPYPVLKYSIHTQVLVQGGGLRNIGVVCLNSALSANLIYNTPPGHQALLQAGH